MKTAEAPIRQARQRTGRWRLRLQAARDVAAAARDTALTLVCAGILALGAPHAAELRADLESPDFQACWDRIDLGAMKNSQRIACLHAEHQRLQALLDEQSLRLRQAPDPPALAAYAASLRAWAVWRDRWCELEAVHHQAPTLGSANCSASPG